MKGWSGGGGAAVCKVKDVISLSRDIRKVSVVVMMEDGGGRHIFEGGKAMHGFSECGGKVVFGRRREEGALVERETRPYSNMLQKDFFSGSFSYVLMSAVKEGCKGCITWSTAWKLK